MREHKTSDARTNTAQPQTPVQQITSCTLLIHSVIYNAARESMHAKIGAMNPAAYERLFEMLGHSSLDAAIVDAVLAAADGPDALTAVLDGERRPDAPAPAHAPEPAPNLVYLEQIAVEGFRGIADRARLQFEPGPGLTLIAGRNGSGKSSFAEALEVLLTGTTLRWEDRTKVWREGWRSLHHDGATEISASFRVDGEPQPLILSRAWPPRAGLDQESHS